jgi:SAM-dependent methyltransferase
VSRVSAWSRILRRMTEEREPTVVEEAGPDWAAYYRHTLGREPRPLFSRGMALVRAAGLAPGQAVEVGFGDGTETLALLADGWRVLANDATAAAEGVLRARLPADASERLEVRIAPAQDVWLPPFDLLYSGYSLSFLAPDDFARFWARARDALRPGGMLVVNVFGVRDTWATETSMTFVDREGVDRLVAGLELLDLREEDADGPAFSGPKHWHLFDIVARRPVG